MPRIASPACRPVTPTELVIVPGVALSKVRSTPVVVTTTSGSALVEVAPRTKKNARRREVEIVRSMAFSLHEAAQLDFQSGRLNDGGMFLEPRA